MVSTLALSGVSKAFGSKPVLQNLSLEIANGEFVAVLGSSGSGKTTLLRLIAGFDDPDSGGISISGKLVASKNVFVAAEARRVGYVPQDAALFPHLSVFEKCRLWSQGSKQSSSR